MYFYREKFLVEKIQTNYILITMKNQLRFLITFLMLAVTTIPVIAFNYYITFTGSGASTTVDSVIVQNLSKGTQVTVPSGIQLQLYDVNNSVEGVNTTSNLAFVYPNPTTGDATFTFSAKNAGNTQIAVYKLDGTKIAGLDTDVPQGENSFQYTLPTGMYMIQVKGNDFSYTAKTISISFYASEPKISFNGNTTNSKQQKAPTSDVKLQYSIGEQILFKGFSGNYCSIVTDKPTSSKTTDFKFVECIDVEVNHYAVVTIGTQTWMAENLKTTHYRNGDDIGTTTKTSIPNDATSNYQWAHNNDENRAAKYGRLYTWWAATDARNIAPIGWHLPTDAEWTILENYLIANGYNFDGTTTGNKIAKSLSSTTDWITYKIAGTPGNDLPKNNSTGFTALPSGDRTYYGSFFGFGSHVRWQSSNDIDANSAWIRYLGYGNNFISRSSGSKIDGFSVRCLRD